MKPTTLLILQGVAGIASAMPAGSLGQAGAVAKRDTPSLGAQMQALAQQLDAHKQATAGAAGLDTAPIPIDQLEQAAGVSPEQLQALADQMNAEFVAAGVDPAAPAPSAKVARQALTAQQITGLAQQLSENLAAAAAAAGLNPASLPTVEEEVAMTPEQMQALADKVAAEAAAKQGTSALQARQLAPQQVTALAQQLRENLSAAAAAAGISPTALSTAEQDTSALTPEELQAIADKFAAEASEQAPTGTLQARQGLTAQQIAGLAQQLRENLSAALAAAGLNTASLPTAEQDAAMTPEQMQALADQVAATVAGKPGASLPAKPSATVAAPKASGTSA